MSQFRNLTEEKVLFWFSEMHVTIPKIYDCAEIGIILSF